MFPKFLTLIAYKFSTQLQLANEKYMSMQQETSPHLSGFPLRCCDQHATNKALFHWLFSIKLM
jgi:hypothetical protein